MMEEITRNRVFSGDLRMLQPTRGLVLRIPWQVVPGAFAIRNGGRVWNGYLWVLRFKPRNSKRFCRVPCHQELIWAEVQANKDYAARFHRDKNNLGPSWIMAHFASSRGNFLGLFQKKMETQNSIVSHCVFHIKKGYRCIPYLKTNTPILAAGRLALYLGFWGAFVFVL